MGRELISNKLPSATTVTRLTVGMVYSEEKDVARVETSGMRIAELKPPERKKEDQII